MVSVPRSFFPDVLRAMNYAHSIVLLLMILSAPLAASARVGVDEQLLEAEQTLSGLGYWVLKVDGIADASTRHAITAFQKVEGRKRTGRLNGELLEALRYASRPTPRFKSGRAHIEIDIGRQVLFLTDEQNTVVRILPVSTGNEKRYFDQGKW